jgi:pimeloyl-ACP methyl ester carboxylesterase
VLARHGYGVLLVDARGHGASTGRPMPWGWDGDADVAAAVAHLGSRDDVDPDRLAGVGLSMGGEEAIGAAAALPQVRAVVAEGVTGRTADDLAWLTDAYGWRGSVTRGVHAAQTALVDVLADPPRPAPLAQAVGDVAPRPVLLVTAGGVPDEGHAAEALRRAAPDAVSVWTVDGAGHTEGLRTDPEGWEERVVGFLDAATGPSGAAG